MSASSGIEALAPIIEAPVLPAAEVPFFERPDWKPMSESEIADALDQLKNVDGSASLYLPDFYCRQQGLNFEEENRSPSLKEMLTKPKQMSARERPKAKLDARKKSAAEADG